MSVYPRIQRISNKADRCAFDFAPPMKTGTFENKMADSGQYRVPICPHLPFTFALVRPIICETDSGTTIWTRPMDAEFQLAPTVAGLRRGAGTCDRRWHVTVDDGRRNCSRIRRYRGHHKIAECKKRLGCFRWRRRCPQY